jgi:hypothetical protein
VQFSTFAEFVTTPPLEGLGVTLDQLRGICRSFWPGRSGELFRHRPNGELHGTFKPFSSARCVHH